MEALEALTWDGPKYKKTETIPFISTELELDQLIASCGKKTGTFLQGLKDKGTDPGELAAITWMDIDKERKMVTINRPVKGHRPRILSASEEFINRIELLPKNSEKVFGNQRSLATSFYTQRKRIARKMANPRLRRISLTTFRDWRLTMEAHRTRDPFQVMKISGHKTMQSIMFYIELEKVVFGPGQDEFTVRVANNVGEACELIEAAFEYVTGDYNDGGKNLPQTQIARQYVHTLKTMLES